MMELLTAEEVAKLLKCSQEFVYKNRSLLGGIKIGRLVRFQLNRIKEVILNGGKTRNDMALRLYEEGSEIQERRISDKGGGKRCRGEVKTVGAEDKYGLYEIVQQSVKGCGTEEE